MLLPLARILGPKGILADTESSDDPVFDFGELAGRTVAQPPQSTFPHYGGKKCYLPLEREHLEGQIDAEVFCTRESRQERRAVCRALPEGRGEKQQPPKHENRLPAGVRHIACLRSPGATHFESAIATRHGSLGSPLGLGAL